MQKKYSIYYYSVLLFMPFFLWSFLGGHKQTLYGVSTDHIATSLALFSSLVVLSSIRFSKDVYKYLLSIYILFYIFCLLSFLLNLNSIPEGAIHFLITSATYFLISIAVSVLFKNNKELFFSIVKFSGLFSASVIIISFLVLGGNSWGRMTIPILEHGKFYYYPDGYSSSSDPNVLAFFLGFSFITIIFLKGKSWFMHSSVVLTAILLTQSRSAIFALIFSVIIYFIFTFKYKIKHSHLYGFVFIFFLMIFYIYTFIGYDVFLDNVLARIYHDGSNQDRVGRLLANIEIMFSSPLSFLFGHGPAYSRANIDPHNLYISTIVDTGVFSFVLLYGAVFYLFLKCFKAYESSNIRWYVLSMFCFFCIISLFYWQVRTYYFLIMVFCVLLASASRRRLLADY